MPQSQELVGGFFNLQNGSKVDSGMSASALEEKKAVAMHDTNGRNRQAKVKALHKIEMASYSNNSYSPC